MEIIHRDAGGRAQPQAIRWANGRMMLRAGEVATHECRQRRVHSGIKPRRRALPAVGRSGGIEPSATATRPGLQSRSPSRLGDELDPACSIRRRQGAMGFEPAVRLWRAGPAAASRLACPLAAWPPKLGCRLDRMGQRAGSIPARPGVETGPLRWRRLKALISEAGRPDSRGRGPIAAVRTGLNGTGENGRGLMKQASQLEQLRPKRQSIPEPSGFEQTPPERFVKRPGLDRFSNADTSRFCPWAPGRDRRDGESVLGLEWLGVPEPESLARRARWKGWGRVVEELRRSCEGFWPERPSITAVSKATHPPSRDLFL